MNTLIPLNKFVELQNYCKKSKLKKIEFVNHAVQILQVPNSLLPYLEVNEHRLILSFIRKRTLNVPIVTPEIVNGQKVSLSYITPITKNKELICIYTNDVRQSKRNVN